MMIICDYSASAAAKMMPMQYLQCNNGEVNGNDGKYTMVAIAFGSHSWGRALDVVRFEANLRPTARTIIQTAL